MQSRLIRSELIGETSTDGTRHAYAYDNIGNRITAQNNATATSYQTNHVNQYSAIATQGQATFTPAYDAAGNQTLIRTATGTWNAQHNADNRPTSFQQGDRRITSVYDFMGRHIEKTTSNNSGLTKRFRYIYHGYVQIAEIDATDATTPYVTKTYRWDSSEPVATRPLTLSLWTREGTVRETLYYAHDLRKNVVSLFDALGMRRASYEYDPYGNITSMDGDMAESNPYRYSSEHHDEDLGLVYYNYRHYNPTDGRWTSRDPIAEKGGWNLYGFVENRPLDVIDLLGQSPKYPDCCQTELQKIAAAKETFALLKQRFDALIEEIVKKRIPELESNPKTLPLEPPTPDAPKRASVRGHVEILNEKMQMAFNRAEQLRRQQRTIIHQIEKLQACRQAIDPKCLEFIRPTGPIIVVENEVSILDCCKVGCAAGAAAVILRLSGGKIRIALPKGVRLPPVLKPLFS